MILFRHNGGCADRNQVLSDADISTPVPHAPEAVFGSFDWLQAMSRFGRFLSKAYSSLFSISTTLISAETLHAAVEAHMDELEAWRISIPEDFRPGSDFPPPNVAETTLMAMALRLNYHYYSAVIALSRLYLNLPRRNSHHRSTEYENALLVAACRVVELTKFIDLASYTPIWYSSRPPPPPIPCLLAGLQDKSLINEAGSCSPRLCQLPSYSLTL
jgi:hypothetical protein